MDLGHLAQSQWAMELEWGAVCDYGVITRIWSRLDLVVVARVRPSSGLVGDSGVTTAEAGVDVGVEVLLEVGAAFNSAHQMQVRAWRDCCEDSGGWAALDVVHLIARKRKPLFGSRFRSTSNGFGQIWNGYGTMGCVSTRTRTRASRGIVSLHQRLSGSFLRVAERVGSAVSVSDERTEDSNNIRDLRYTGGSSLYGTVVLAPGAITSELARIGGLEAEGLLLPSPPTQYGGY